MRVPSCGSLAVDLIRHARFGLTNHCTCRRLELLRCQADTHVAHHLDLQIDRVQLSCHALAPAAVGIVTSGPSIDRPHLPYDKLLLTNPVTTKPLPLLEPQRLSPVIGSPALAGLGVALIVPGSLLDVVA